MAAKLFEAASIGKLSIRNRLVMPPMLMGYGSAEGYVTQRMLDYFEERAKGGVGMVIVEAVGIRFEGKVYPYFINCYDETHLPGLTQLADVIKKHGATAAIQIADGGRNTREELTGERPIAPSPIATHKRDQPRVLTTEEVRAFVMRFVNAIVIAKRAGFDGVEIHAAHVYFLNQFLSAISNIRTDAYGGSIEKRARILVEIVEEARKLVGDYPIWVRINAEEPGEENGITIDQAKQIAQIAERAGYDAISVSSGGSHYEATIGSMYFPRGYLVPFAEQIKQVVNIPVIAVGRIDARLAEQVVAEGRADFVAIGRGLMVDPELPRKAQEGRYDDIAPCLSCLNCVHRGVLRDTPITCSVNAALGREAELKLLPAETKRNVLVIGGGPAGLEAARVAATRGHKVTLVHSGEALGGEFRLVGAAPQKEPILGWIDYMTKQLAKHKVSVRVKTEASAKLVEEIKPDVLIVATGPEGGGRQGRTSASPKDRVVRLQDVLAGRAEIGGRVVILGDDAMAAETADLLSEQGKNVTLVGAGRKIAPAMLNLIRSVLLKRLSDKNVVQMTGTQVGAISATGVEVIGKDSQRQTLAADTIVLGNAYKADTELLSAVGSKVSALYLIGGCRRAGDQQDAIADGYTVARLI